MSKAQGRGWGTGPRVFRTETEGGELLRIIFTGILAMILGLLMVLLLLLNTTILGDAARFFLWFNLALWPMRFAWRVHSQYVDERAKPLTMPTMLLATFLWLPLAWLLATKMLPPAYYGLQLWRVIWVQPLFVIIEFTLYLMLWATWVEIIDPGHSMRHSMLDRLKPIWPWSEPNREGDFGPEGKVEYVDVIPPARELKVTLEIPGMDHYQEIRRIEGLNTREWWNYLKMVLEDWDSVLEDKVTWAEDQPRLAGISISRAQFRHVRDQLLEHLWIRWINPAHKNMGTTPNFKGFLLWMWFTNAPAPAPEEQTHHDYWVERDEGA